MALKQSRFLQRLLSEHNVLSPHFKPENLPDTTPKQERTLLDVLSLGTLGEWNDDGGELVNDLNGWEDPLPDDLE